MLPLLLPGQPSRQNSMVRALAGGVRCPAKEWPAKHKRGLRSFCHTQASNTPPGAQRAHLRLHSTVMYTHSRHYTTPQHTDPQHSSTYNTTQSHHTYTPINTYRCSNPSLFHSTLFHSLKPDYLKSPCLLVSWLSTTGQEP